MIKTKKYIRLQEVLSRCLRHPMLQDIDIEAAIQYALDFIHAVGAPDMFEPKEAIIEISNYRGQLPCDIVSVNQVMDLHTNKCMRSMTDTFDPYKAPCNSNHYHELTFKLQNSVIVTSIETGQVKMSYMATPVDDDGYPLLIDNPTYLKALELYIKKEVFTILYDMGKIAPGALLNTQLEYAWKVGLLQSEMNIPSISEMESLCRSWTTLIQRTTEFDDGFRNLGNREYLRRH